MQAQLMHLPCTFLPTCSSANGSTQKMYNWNTLNQKVFKRMGFTIPKSECDAIVNCQQGAIERVLKMVKVKLSKFTDDSFAGWVRQAGRKALSMTKCPGSWSCLCCYV